MTERERRDSVRSEAYCPGDVLLQTVKLRKCFANTYKKIINKPPAFLSREEDNFSMRHFSVYHELSWVCPAL